MEYKRKNISKQEEREIITAMIVSTEFLKDSIDFCDPNLLTLPYARSVANWCINYFSKYDKAPFKDIRGVENHVDFIHDPVKKEMVVDFLASLSQKFEEDNSNFNVGYHIDKAVNYFKGLSLDKVIENIRQARLVEDYSGAEAIIANYQRIEKNISEGIDVWSDADAVVRTVRDEHDGVLFQFPGELGKLVRPFRRSEFITFVGPAKRGKSWLLIYMAYLASLMGLNVLFFSFEMPERDVLLRLYQMLTGCVVPENNEYSEVVSVEMPYFSASGAVEHVSEKKRCVEIKNVLGKLSSIQTMVKSKKFRLECAPANSVSIEDMNNRLDNLEHYDDFIPDVILSDYADITRSEYKGEKRHQIDDIWMGCRAISQKRNCLFGTVSHSNKATFDRDVRQNDLSEDGRKLNHVTWAGALNQTEEENEDGVMRISTIADRFQRYSTLKEAVVLQNFDTGQVCIDSKIVRKEKS